MFGVDLTWLGWTYLALWVLGILISIFGGLAGNSSHTEPEVRIFTGFLSLLILIGFFTIGFTH